MRFTEATFNPSFTVDEANKVIRNVKILGLTSKNNRRYLQEACDKAIPLFENAPTNADHDRSGSERSISSRTGWLENVKSDGNGLSGDWHYLESSPTALMIVEAAKRNPSLFGFSIDASGSVENKNGTATVTEITEVHSVDTVSSPATTKSLKESTGAKPMKIGGILESIDKRKKHPIIMLLREMCGKDHIKEMDAMGDEDEIVEMDDEQKARHGVMSALVEKLKEADDDMLKKVLAMLDGGSSEDEDMSESVKKIEALEGQIAKLQESLKNASDGEKQSAAMAAQIEALKESLAKSQEQFNAMIKERDDLKLEGECRQLLESAGIEVTPTKLKALKLADEADRKGLIESFVPTIGSGVRPVMDSGNVTSGEELLEAIRKS